ncbi:MAG: NifU family protein [Bacteroidota bacterium]
MSRTNSDIENRINIALTKVRPYLNEDEGDVELVRFEEGTNILEVRFLGNCKDCPLSMMTLRAGIERFVQKEVPEIRRVELVE